MDGHQQTLLCNQKLNYFQFCQVIDSQERLSYALAQLAKNGVNENIACYLLWYAVKCYGRVTKKIISRLIDAVTPWSHAITDELQFMKGYLEKYRPMHDIVNWLETEIQYASFIERVMILDEMPPRQLLKRHIKQNCTDACWNIYRFYQQKKLVFSDADLDVWRLMLKNIFSHLSEEVIDKTFDSVVDKVKVKAPVQLSF